MTGLWSRYLSYWVFMALTTDSPVHESTSHGFIFSTDRSNISRSCEAGHWRFLRSCLFCTPSLCRKTLPRAPWIVLCPAQQRCWLWQMHVRSKIILLILSLGFGDSYSLRTVGSAAAGQAGCPAMAHAKQWSTLSIMGTWAQHFCCTNRNVLWRN